MICKLFYSTVLLKVPIPSSMISLPTTFPVLKKQKVILVFHFVCLRNNQFPMELWLSRYGTEKTGRKWEAEWGITTKERLRDIAMSFAMVTETGTSLCQIFLIYLMSGLIWKGSTFLSSNSSSFLGHRSHQPSPHRAQEGDGVAQWMKIQMSGGSAFWSATVLQPLAVVRRGSYGCPP